MQKSKRKLKFARICLPLKLRRVNDKGQAEQVKQVGIFGKWFALELKPFKEKIPQTPEKVAKEARRIKIQIRKKNPSITARRIKRPVKFCVNKKNKSLQVFVGTTDYLTMLASSGEWNKQSRKILPSLAKQGKQFQAIPYHLSSNVIVEVVDAQGNPTHLVLVKRADNLPQMPGFLDFPAGIIMQTATPAGTALKRIERETGIKESEIEFLGPGFRKAARQENPPVFTFQTGEVLSDGNLVFVARAKITPEELQKRAREIGATIELIPRNPKAISRIVGTGKTVFPQPLKMYAREIAKQAK